MFEGITAGDKDFSTTVARLKKENIDFVYFGGYYPEMGQILRQAKQAGLTTRFMGPEGVGNSSLSNIAGAASEGMLVTLPKRYDGACQPADRRCIESQEAGSDRPVRLDHLCRTAVADHRHGRSGGREPADIVRI